MKKLVAITVLVVLIPSLCGHAQSLYDVDSLLRKDMTRAGANMDSYPDPTISDARAPRGYKPFYISHYGRHGSRSDNTGPTREWLIGVLESADLEGMLSENGHMVLSEAKALSEAVGGMTDRLSPRGAREHAGIADRLYHRYRRIFRGKAAIRSVSSTAPRCLISQNSFTNSLMANNPRLKVSLDTGEEYMKYLAYVGTKELSDSIRRVADSLIEKMNRELPPVDTVSIRGLLFNDVEASYGFASDCGRLMDAMYCVARIAEGFDVADCIYGMLPFDYVKRRWSQSNSLIYMCNCNSIECGARRVKASDAVLADIVAKADEAIACGKIAADLRFGHDLPLLSLAGRLGIEGVGDQLGFEDVNTHWMSFFNIPMASNLQLVFYRNRKNDILVKFLYQEKECRLNGIEPVCGPYYGWNAVKQAILEQ